MHGFFKKAFLSATAAALVFSFACSKKQESPRLEHNLLSFYSETDTSTAFFADDKELDDRIGGAITSIGSVDGTEGFVVAASALYRINTEGLLKIYPAAVTNAVPALDGGRILFATARMVHLYDEATRNYTKLEGIEDDVIDACFSFIVRDNNGFAIKQLDGYLKAGLIDKKEYREMLERYTRLDHQLDDY